MGQWNRGRAGEWRRVVLNGAVGPLRAARGFVEWLGGAAAHRFSWW